MVRHEYTAGLLGSPQLGAGLALDDRDELTAIQHTRYGGVSVTVLTVHRTDRDVQTIRIPSDEHIELDDGL
ncbi:MULTISPECIES: hypothetical protein [unclassified Curtobacterium]|uniref:hypothetical protein n=1 Tax=unclassified Curtobacterium TaxID=257496 RepID=UPI003A7FBEC4